MAGNLIEQLRLELTHEIEYLGYELVDLEYVKENGENFLRFYIYNPEGTTIDDCERCSIALDSRLDELDIIKDSYYLEVSTPDLNRPLKTDDDLRRNLGVTIDVSLYRKINGKKEYRGDLLSYDKDSVTLQADEVIRLERKDISKIKVAIIF